MFVFDEKINHVKHNTIQYNTIQYNIRLIRLDKTQTIHVSIN